MATPSTSIVEKSNPSDEEILFDATPFMKMYKSGRVERLTGDTIAPPGLDPTTGVQSKDVYITQDKSVGARLFIPKSANADKKLPVFVYIHGGGFCIGTPYSPTYHNYMNSLVAEANIIGVSLDYRLGPEFVLPVQYDDSWAMIKWVAAHSTGQGSDQWLNQFADFNRMFIGGGSAGGNIAHHMSVKMGTEPPPKVKFAGLILFDPFFWGEERIGGEKDRDKAIIDLLNNICKIVIPDIKNYDHPWVNPKLEPEKLKKIGTKRILLCLSEADFLMYDRGEAYFETLKASDWDGKVEKFLSPGVGHGFFVSDPNHELATKLMKKVAEYLNVESPA